MDPVEHGNKNMSTGCKNSYTKFFFSGFLRSFEKYLNMLRCRVLNRLNPVLGGVMKAIS